MSSQPGDVDYLLIGHVTQDLTPRGPVLGGTAAYAALTARSMGLRVGIVTACAIGLELPELDGIDVTAVRSEYSTTFENINTPTGRIQYIHHVAPPLTADLIPEAWKSARIVHLAPVANELNPSILQVFSNSFIGVTPQGFMRAWNGDGIVFFKEWTTPAAILDNAAAVVLSLEDVCGSENRIETLVASSRILVVTEGAAGSRVYWNGDVRRIRPPREEELDPTGAGDIFAAAFFIRLNETRDPWEAARFATQLAARSVTRPGMEGVPTSTEVQSARVEILQ